MYLSNAAFRTIKFVISALIVGIRRIQRRRAKLSSSMDSNQLIKVSVMAIVVSVTYIILTGPYAILRFLVHKEYYKYWLTPEVSYQNIPKIHP